MDQIGEKSYGAVDVGPPGPPATTVATAPGPRRRWVRRILVAALVLVLLLAAATVGIGYYFSSVLLKVDNSVSYPVTVTAVNGQEVTLSRDSDTEKPAVLGLVWDGGSAILSNSIRVSDDAVVRTVTTKVRGSLQPGLKASIDSRVFTGDPKTARELSFDNVTVKGELGELPAWYVPPTAGRSSTTWAIAVHGLGASRTETLRVLPMIAKAGLPTLAISYRNDPGAPASPDGYYHLGDTEWQDVVSAISYARDHGATGVVLYAWSMGGALSMTALRRLPAAESSLIKGLVLDSANIDWNAILEYQGSQRGLPPFVIWTAKRFIEWRADLSLDDFDQRPYAAQLKVPVLVYIDTADQTVPNEPAIEFAQSRPDLITLAKTSSGGHTASWNVNPDSYESTVTAFLTKVAG